MRDVTMMSYRTILWSSVGVKLNWMTHIIIMPKYGSIHVAFDIDVSNARKNLLEPHIRSVSGG